MFGLGTGELLLVLVLFVLVFNRRLPGVGESFGAAIRKFKKALNEPDEIDVTPPADGAKDGGIDNRPAGGTRPRDRED
jgi:sec-independent protein translocase protein TatA